MALNSWFRFSRMPISGLFVLLLASVQPAYAERSPVVKPIVSSCVPFKGRKLTLVIPFKPGGGYDLMGRFLAPFLTSYTGMSVVVSNVTGAGGVLAGQAIAKSTNSRPVVGLVDLTTLAMQIADGATTVKLSDLQGLGILASDPMVWISKNRMDWARPPTAPLLSPTATLPFARIAVPSQLMGVQVNPLYGYEGTNEAWMALLRGDVDIVVTSAETAKRYLATGAQAEVSLALTEQALSDFPNVPHLAGPGGLVDARTNGLAALQRQRLMELATMAALLSESTRTLVTSKKLSPELRNCLQTATQAVLFETDLVAKGKLQKIAIQPLDARATETKIRRIDADLKKHSAYFKQTSSADKVGR